MVREFESDIESGAERVRSTSGATDSGVGGGLGGGWRGNGEGPVGEGLRDPEGEPEEAGEGGWSDIEGSDGELDGGQGESAEGVAQGPRRTVRGRGRKLVKAQEGRQAFTSQQRILILDAWRRSELPATDFAPLVGLSLPTLYSWRAKLQRGGPEALLGRPRGAPKGSRLPEVTRRTILMMKEAHPEWGCQRISDTLQRGPGLGASAGAVARVLREEGYVLQEEPTKPHPDRPREFERARPNQLWQTDLFSFILKRQNRRVFLVAFLDDNSRFIVGYGLHGTQSAALVMEVLRAAIASYRTPEEILTDNGTQYVTWRGKSLFQKELEKLGVRHVVASPRHPQTLGKTERFWGSLWRECVGAAVFLDMEDARRRIGLYIDHYNFQRPHQGIGGLCPADRYFGAAPEVLETLKARVAGNALDLARQGVPRAPFYLTGQVGGKNFSVHAEGERVIMKRGDGERQEVELSRPQEPVPQLPEPICPAGVPAPEGGVIFETGPEEVHEPGVSPLDGALVSLGEGLVKTADHQDDSVLLSEEQLDLVNLIEDLEVEPQSSDAKGEPGQVTPGEGGRS
jgi:transposase InsO family protein